MSPSTKPTDASPTLADLYQAIDWSKANNTLDRWQRQHHSKDIQTDEFTYLWRCALLESALYGETEERMREARGWLAMAGVWDQIVHYLTRNNFT